MAIPKTDFIWHNGKTIPWDSATVHVLSHVVNYDVPSAADTSVMQCAGDFWTGWADR